MKVTLHLKEAKKSSLTVLLVFHTVLISLSRREVLADSTTTTNLIFVLVT